MPGEKRLRFTEIILPDFFLKALVKRYFPALSLSVKVVKTLALAASIGVPLGGVLPSITLPDLEHLEATFLEGLEAAENEAIE